MLRVIKGIFCYLGMVVVYFFSEYIGYKGRVNFKEEALIAIVGLVGYIIVEIICAIVKKIKKDND